MKDVFRNWANFCGLSFNDLREEQHFIVIELESYTITMNDLKWLSSYIEQNNYKLEVFSIDAVSNFVEVWLHKNDNYED